MYIYLFRHGIAVNVGDKEVKRDSDRMLSGEGREKTRTLSKLLWRSGIRPERIISSPLVRAVETAEIFSFQAGAGLVVEQESLLQPGVDFAAITIFLSSIHEKYVMLVGHEPDLSGLAWYWIAGAGRALLRMKPAGICCVSFENTPAKAQGLLEWHLNPTLILKMADDQDLVKTAAPDLWWSERDSNP